MGMVKLFDLRVKIHPNLPPNSASGLALFSILAHSANRPRKLKKILPNYYNNFNFATFSDAVGDYVKIWDLRMLSSSRGSISNEKNKSPNSPLVSSINPYCVDQNFDNNDIQNLGSTSTSIGGFVTDIAWSPIQKGVLAISTSQQNRLGFYRINNLDNDSPSNTIISSPLYTIPVESPVKNLSWQLNSVVYENFNEMKNNSEELMKLSNIPLPISSGPNTSSTFLPIRWESNNIEWIQNPVDNAISNPKFTSTITQSSSAPPLALYSATFSNNRLIGSTSQGTYYLEPSNGNPFGLGTNRIVLSNHCDLLISKPFDSQLNLLNELKKYKNFDEDKLAKYYRSVNEVTSSAGEDSYSTTISLWSYLMDQGSVMKDRAKSGYSLDTYSNLDVIIDELDFFYSKINFQNSQINDPSSGYMPGSWTKNYPDTNANSNSVSLMNSVVINSVEGVGISVTLPPPHSKKLLKKLYKRFILNIFELFRVWSWIDRVETNSSHIRPFPSFQDVGVQTILNPIWESMENDSENKSIINKGISNRTQWLYHNNTGAIVYFSLERVVSKELCGWSNVLFFNDEDLIKISQNIISKSSESSFTYNKSNISQSPFYGDEIMLNITIDDTHYSFERASILALWHGALQKSVEILQESISLYNATGSTLSSSSLSPQNKKRRRNSDLASSNSSSYSGEFTELNDDESSDEFSNVEWDSPPSDDYMKTVALVAMCIAGYHPVELHCSPTGVSQSSNPSSNLYSTSSPAQRAAWKSMCRLVMKQLENSERISAGYLLAGVQFLYDLTVFAYPDEVLESKTHFREKKTSKANDSNDNLDPFASKKLFSNIFHNKNLILEDKLSFGLTYLNDKLLKKWIKKIKIQCISSGHLSGLVVTGFQDEGFKILQSYLDNTNDIQTTALLSCRALSLGMLTKNVEKDKKAPPTMRGSSQIKQKNSFDFKDNPPGRSNKEVDNTLSSRLSLNWLQDYRELLCKWEMHVSRAYLDIEVGEHLKKLKISSAGLSNASSSSVNKSIRNAFNKNTSQSTNTKYYDLPYSNLMFNIKNSTQEMIQLSTINLKCNFCNNLLPIEEIQTSRFEILRNQKNILNCCAFCNKQLPRCYVCHLNLVSSIHFFFYYFFFLC